MACIFTYVLLSLRDGKHYVGISHDPLKRLLQHNSGKVISTKSRRPFIFVQSYPHQSYAEARTHEKYLKTAAGRRSMNQAKL